MHEVDEARAVEQIYQRLSTRFPNLPTETVRATVQEVHTALTGRVRDYVPILVERGAMDRLLALAASPPAPSD